MKTSSAAVVIVGFLLAACGAAQTLGASQISKREFEISNKSKEPLCSVDVVNLKNVVKGGDTITKKIDIQPGATKVETLEVAEDQDRTLRFKSCKGAVVKEQSFPYAKERAHVDVQ